MDDEQRAEPAEEAPPPERRPRRYPSTVGGFFYLLVLGVVAAGIWITHDTSNWRDGVRIVGFALAAASLLRLVLPARDAGMLAVRSRALDVLLLASVAAALVFLAGDIPDQPM